jgi:hypothetical protein
VGWPVSQLCEAVLVSRAIYGLPRAATSCGERVRRGADRKSGPRVRRHLATEHICHEATTKQRHTVCYCNLYPWGVLGRRNID